MNKHTRALVCRLVGAGLALAAVQQLTAQITPVYVDDSPIAWEIFREAQDQASVNVGEAVRLYQEILDDFALRLIHADVTSQDRFMSARRRVLDELLRHAEPGGLLERHRIRERAEAQRLHEAGEFDRLALTRPWTEAGLDALMRIAQREVESARFDAANSALELVLQHPDLPSDARTATHAWYLHGVAGSYSDDDSQVAQSLETLQAFVADGQREATALLEQLRSVQAEPGPAIATGVTPLDVGSTSPSVTLTDLVAEEIWSVPLPETLYSRRFNQNAARGQLRRGRDQARMDGLLMTSAPTVVGGDSNGLVYINQGHHIAALDRFTGSPMWPLVGGFVERPPLTIIDRDDDHARDLNVIAVEHDALVTLTGHAHASSRSNEGRVLCLDANTGEFRWSTRLDRVTATELEADEHEGMFPHSAPVIAEGRVFVLARKISPQSLMSTYLVALDLQDGAVIWIRHIASSGSIRRASRAFSTLQYSEGDLYLNTAVGAVARVHAASGETRWLHRFDVPLNPAASEQMRRPWELDMPVVTPNYVISLLPAIPGAAAATTGQRVLVLDRQTGHEVATFDVSGAGWGTPSYLLSAGVESPWIFAVGDDIRAFHVDDLHTPVWSYPGVGATALEVQGRVHVVAQQDESVNRQNLALIVPSDSGILIVDAHNGLVVNRLDLAEHGASSGIDEQYDSSPYSSGNAGNPVVVDSQLFIADNEQVRSYMAMSHAVGMLRERIDAEPGDPAPGMALLRLAIAAAGNPDETKRSNQRESDVELVIAAANAVMRSVSLSSDAGEASAIQSQLFAQMLELNIRSTELGVEQGEAYFALLRDVIASGVSLQEVSVDEQQVDYLLAYGDWLTAKGLHESAAEAFQTVLHQPALAQVRRAEGDVLRPGGAWAMRRLQAISALDGATHIEPTMKLEQRLTARPRIGMQSGEAILLDGALAPTRVVANDASESDAAARRGHWMLLVRGTTLSLFDTMGSAESSHRLHRRWIADAPAMPDTEGGVPFGNHDGPTAEVWPVSGGRMIVWTGGIGISSDSSGRFIMMDQESGRALWVSPGVNALFGEVARRFRVAGSERASRRSAPGVAGGAFASGASQGPRGSIDEPLDRAETFALINGHAAFLVRRDGSAARFGLDDGSTATWIARELLDDVHHAALADGMVVLAGRARIESTVESSRRGDMFAPALVVLDAASGEILGRGSDDKALLLATGAVRNSRDGRNTVAALDASVSWMQVHPAGLIVCGTADGVQAWDVVQREFLWMNSSSRAAGTTRGWIAGTHVWVETSDGDVCSIDLQEALVSSMVGSFEVDAIDVWGPVRQVIAHDAEAAEASTKAMVHYANRIAWYDESGVTVGTDFVQDERNYRWVLPARDCVVAVSAHHPRQQPVQGRSDGMNARRTHHVYSIYTLSHNGGLLDEPIQLPALFEPLRDAQLIDGWLLLSTSEHTIAVPFPVEG